MDVEDINTAINYEYPSIFEEYVHRVSRNSILRKTGRVTTLFSEKYICDTYNLIKLLKMYKQLVSIELCNMDTMGPLYRIRRQLIECLLCLENNHSGGEHCTLTNSWISNKIGLTSSEWTNSIKMSMNTVANRTTGGRS